MVPSDCKETASNRLRNKKIWLLVILSMWAAKWGKGKFQTAEVAAKRGGHKRPPSRLCMRSWVDYCSRVSGGRGLLWLGDRTAPATYLQGVERRCRRTGLPSRRYGLTGTIFLPLSVFAIL